MWGYGNVAEDVWLTIRAVSDRKKNTKPRVRGRLTRLDESDEIYWEEDTIRL